MKPTVYIETSVISYLTSRPSRDLLVAAHQQITHDWWDNSSEGCLPKKAAEDALHIASATIHRMNYLLTWNCKHIANSERRPEIERVIRDNGYQPPIISTPEELLGE